MKTYYKVDYLDENSDNAICENEITKSTEHFTYLIRESLIEENPLCLSIKYADDYKKIVFGNKIEVDEENDIINVYSYSSDEHIDLIYSFYSDRSKNKGQRILDDNSTIYFSNKFLCKNNGGEETKLADLPNTFEFGTSNRPFCYVVPEYSRMSLISSCNYDTLYIYTLSGERMIDEEKKYRYVYYILNSLTSLCFLQKEYSINIDSITSKQYDKSYTMEYIREICEFIISSHNAVYKPYVDVLFDTLCNVIIAMDKSLDEYDIGKMIFMLSYLQNEIQKCFAGLKNSCYGMCEFSPIIFSDYLSYLLQNNKNDISSIIDDYSMFKYKFDEYINNKITNEYKVNDILVRVFELNNLGSNNKLLCCIINNQIIKNTVLGDDVLFDRNNQLIIINNKDGVVYFNRIENSAVELTEGVYKSEKFYYFSGNEFKYFDNKTAVEHTLSTMPDIMLFSSHSIYADRVKITFYQEIDKSNRIIYTYDYEGNLLDGESKKINYKVMLDKILYISNKKEIIENIDSIPDNVIINYDTLLEISAQINNFQEKELFDNILDKLRMIIASVTFDPSTINLYPILINLYCNVYPDEFLYDFSNPAETYNCFLLSQTDYALSEMIDKLSLDRCYEILTQEPKLIKLFVAPY